MASVPSIVLRHLRKAGPAGWSALIAAVARRKRWSERFTRVGDDANLTAAKRRLGLVGALFAELEARVGRVAALEVVGPLFDEVAVALQRRAYIGRSTWELFHAAHEREMTTGFVAVNDHDAIVAEPDRVAFHVTRCCFYEALRDMGVPELTGSLCRSDERVFPEAVPGMRFHRGTPPETIAAGAPRCTFVFER